MIEDNPLSEIEDAYAQRNLGVVAFRIYQGAREEGATKLEAFMIVVAWFRGVTGASNDNPTDSE